MRVVAVASIALSLSAPSATNASQLGPTSKWNVDFGNTRCLANRTFGPSNHPVYLLVKPSPIGEIMQLQIAEDGSDRRGVQERAQLTFGAGEPVVLSQLRYGIDGKHVRLVNLPKELTAKLAAAKTLRWVAPGSEYQIDTGPMANLIATVEECRLTLADYWNGTKEKIAALQKGPTLRQRSIYMLFSTSDYPSQAVQKSQSGTANVVVLVDENGQVADCTVVETSGVAVLDAQTCIIVRKRGKFDPAVDAAGRPTRGIFTQRVRWAAMQ